MRRGPGSGPQRLTRGTHPAIHRPAAPEPDGRDVEAGHDGYRPLPVLHARMGGAVSGAADEVKSVDWRLPARMLAAHQGQELAEKVCGADAELFLRGGAA